VCVLALLVVLLWRRQYRARIAQQEHDLTRRHAARTQAVLDNAFDAILSLDARGRVATANLAAARLFDRAQEALRGAPLEHLLRGASSAALPEPNSVEPGQMSRTEAIRPSGAGVPVEYSLACSEQPTGRFYTLIARDIAGRVEAERQIQSFAKGLEISNRRLEEANSQLEQSSRLKSEFLANTSHELRTPLNGMMGFLQLVLDGMCDSKDEERDFLNQALQCSKHLLGLINDVLDIAKIEAGRLVLQFEPIDVGAMFEEVLMVTRVQAQQKGLKLVFETPPANTLPVRGDFGKVKQVLINLVGNSLKFTDQGSITVRAELSEPAGHWMFEIVDTGIGIPKDRQGVIFEKFMQADGSTTRRYGGTGLGLAITRSLIELMGGVIGVESQEGRGTRMYFSLPIWRGGEELPTPSESGESLLPDLISGPPGGALVLIVDDDSVFRRFVTALLQQRGYRTAEAAHAEAGWVLVRRLRPTLVLLDYALSCPEGAVLRTGWDLAERMSHDTRTRHIPYLFLTGFDAHLNEKLGEVQFIHQRKCVSKPVDAETLVASVRDVIGDLPNRLVRVLLADDDPTVAAYICKVLPSDRFQVEVVNDGEECLHFLRTQPRGFDLLLLDLMMPQVSGYDVLRDLALTGTAKGVPVIVLTNEPEARNEAERRLLEHGVVLDVLSKTRVHEHPALLPEAIEHHLEAVYQDADYDLPPLEVERFRAEVPEGDAAEASPLGVERFSREPHARAADLVADTATTESDDGDEHQRRAA